MYLTTSPLFLSLSLSLSRSTRKVSYLVRFVSWTATVEKATCTHTYYLVASAIDLGPPDSQPTHADASRCCVALATWRHSPPRDAQPAARIFYTSFASLSQTFPALLPPPQLRPLPPLLPTTTTSAPSVPLGPNIPVYHNITSPISPRTPDFNELHTCI